MVSDNEVPVVTEGSEAQDTQATAQGDVFDTLEAEITEDLGTEGAPPSPGQPQAPDTTATRDLLANALYGSGVMFAPGWVAHLDHVGQDKGGAAGAAVAIADLWAPLLDRWMPEGAKSPLVVAIAGTFVIVAPCLGVPMRLPPPKEPEKPTAEGSGLRDRPGGGE